MILAYTLLFKSLRSVISRVFFIIIIIIYVFEKVSYAQSGCIYLQTNFPFPHHTRVNRVTQNSRSNPFLRTRPHARVAYIPRKSSRQVSNIYIKLIYRVRVRIGFRVRQEKKWNKDFWNKDWLWIDSLFKFCLTKRLQITSC